MMLIKIKNFEWRKKDWTPSQAISARPKRFKTLPPTCWMTTETYRSRICHRTAKVKLT